MNVTEAVNTMNVTEAINTRRAIKHFDPNHQIPEQDIRQLLEMTMQSGSVNIYYDEMYFYAALSSSGKTTSSQFSFHSLLAIMALICKTLWAPLRVHCIF